MLSVSSLSTILSQIILEETIKDNIAGHTLFQTKSLLVDKYLKLIKIKILKYQRRFIKFYVR